MNMNQRLFKGLYLLNKLHKRQIKIVKLVATLR